MRLAVTFERAIDNTITVKKNGAVLSAHFCHKLLLKRHIALCLDTEYGGCFFRKPSRPKKVSKQAHAAPEKFGRHLRL